MKIVLLNPDTKTRYPQPPLGLLAVGTVLREMGHDVKLLDLNAYRAPLAEFAHLFRSTDIIGLTAMSLGYREAVKIATEIRHQLPNKYIVLGGVQATTASIPSLSKGVFNAVVVGEGEQPDVLLDILGYREGIIKSRNKHRVSLDDLPILDYSLLADYNYKAMPPHGMHGKLMPMLTSRGCPYHCSFCSNMVFGNIYRTQSPERIIREVQHLKSIGVKEVAFYDDLFTIKEKRAYKLMELLTPLGIKWTCQTRVNLVTLDLLRAMKKAGCTAIAYGLESASPEILKELSKDITIEQSEEAVALTKHAGIKVIAYFMIGSPNETHDTIKKTIDWAGKLNPDYAQFSITTALPGSGLWSSRQFDSYAMGGIGNGLCELTGRELTNAVAQAYRRFYISPQYIWRQVVRSLASWVEFRGTIAGLKLFVGGQ